VSRARRPRPPKGAPTQTNIWVATQWLAQNNGRIPLRVPPTELPHLRRLIAAGWLVQDGDAFIAAPGYEDFWATEIAKHEEKHMAREPRYVADFNTVDDLVRHAADDLGATHAVIDGPQTRIYFPRGGEYPYEEARVRRAAGYWHADGPHARRGVSHLPRDAKPVGRSRGRRAAAAEAPRRDEAFFHAGERLRISVKGAQGQTFESFWHTVDYSMSVEDVAFQFAQPLQDGMIIEIKSGPRHDLLKQRVGFSSNQAKVYGIYHHQACPFFIRMTPAGTAEIGLLAGQSVLLGLYFTIPRGSCAAPQAGVGSLFAFLGVACPVCNKILLFVFGSELLLVYFEPVRVYVALAGFLLTGLAVWLKWTRGGSLSTQPNRL